MIYWDGMEAEKNGPKNGIKISLPRARAILFVAPAVLSMVYFITIIFYSGITTSFCLIWPVISAVFLLMGYYAGKRTKKGSEMPAALPTFIFTSFALGIIVIIILMTLVVGHARSSEDTGSADYTIVLGAKVYPNGISKTLKYRLDRAVLYYEENPDTVFVLTGGKAQDDAVPEAIAMYNYLAVNGVPEKQMLMDIKALSTAENMENSMRIIADDIKKREWPVSASAYAPSIAVITSDFHMMRSVRIAKELGAETVLEIPVQSDRVLFIHQCLRECAAILKDYFTGNIKVNEEELPFNKI